MVKWINKRTFFSFFSFFVLVQTWQNILDNGVKGFAPFIIFKSFPPWSRSSSSCDGLYLHGQCLSPRRTLCQRPYSALTLDTSACVRPSAQRVIDVWAKPSALLCSHSGLKIALKRASCRLPVTRWLEGQGGRDGDPSLALSPLPALLDSPRPTCLPNPSNTPGQEGSYIWRYMVSALMHHNVIHPKCLQKQN